MKKLFLDKLFVSFVLLISVLLSSCTTVSKESAEQIISSSIKLAETHVIYGRLDDALDVYNEALSKVSDYRLIYNKAIVYAKTGNLLEAANICNEGYSLFPEKTEFLIASSNYLEKAGLYNEAIEKYKLALIKNPDDFNLRKQLMIICYQSGNKKEAYTQAMNLWINKQYSKEILEVLHSYNPYEWEIMYQVYYPKEKTIPTELPKESSTTDVSL